jgi:GAF domain-containing protein
MTVDRRGVARTISELRGRLPKANDLLEGLQHVAEATRSVVGVDGAGLTLVHEDGPPRWVAASDAAMELLERVQQDLGEGPYLQAYAEDQAVPVEDLRDAPAWSRIAAVVGQLRVCGVLSVPVRLAGQPVGTLDLYSSQPRAWSVAEVEAVAAFAAVAAELIHAAVQLTARDLEVAQLQQALTDRVWIEQAKGVLAATEGLEPEAAFGQLRVKARSASRKLAAVAREVVQDAQRQRLAAWALQDVRVRAAEARARDAEQALQAAQAELAHRIAALDRAQIRADDRDRAADDRDRIADERDRMAGERDRAADHQD